MTALARQLSVVVVNWNSRDDLRACLLSLRAQTHADLEVVVVDNASHDGSTAMLRADFAEVLVLPQSENLGFAEACNRGIVASSGRWVALLNNDAVADPQWAAALVEAASRCPDTCGMLQSLMLLHDQPGRINSTGIELTSRGNGRDRSDGMDAASGAAEVEIFCPTGGACAYRREMLEAIRLPSGYLDRKLFVYYSDMDLGWRARLAAWSARLVPGSVVRHRRQASTRRHGHAWLVVECNANRIRMLLKNASWRFVLRTTGPSLHDIAELLWHGRASAGAALLRAVRGSLRDRQRVRRLARVDRASVEHRWVVD